MFGRTQDMFRAVPPSPPGTARREARGGGGGGWVGGLPGGPVIASSILYRFVVSWSISLPSPLLCSPLPLPSGQHRGRGIHGGPGNGLEYAGPFCGQLVHRVSGAPAVPSRLPSQEHVIGSDRWFG